MHSLDLLYRTNIWINCHECEKFDLDPGNRLPVGMHMIRTPIFRYNREIFIVLYMECIHIFYK